MEQSFYCFHLYNFFKGLNYSLYSKKFKKFYHLQYSSSLDYSFIFNFLLIILLPKIMDALWFHLLCKHLIQFEINYFNNNFLHSILHSNQNCSIIHLHLVFLYFHSFMNFLHMICFLLNFRYGYLKNGLFRCFFHGLQHFQLSCPYSIEKNSK